MTRETFINKQSEAEKQIRQHCISFGLIYAVWLAMLIAIPCLLAFAYCSFYFHTKFVARAVIAGELIFCVLAILVANHFYKRNVLRWVRYALKCPSCRRSLVFLLRWQVEEIAEGRCPHCQETIVDS